MTYQIIGGNFGSEPKESGIVRQIREIFGGDEVVCINGGLLKDLPSELCGDLVLWIPNISNEEEKHYPKKRVGSVLICSKVMREGYTRAESISRIFKMHGNAVIEIRNSIPGYYTFTLVDALNNIWYDGDNIKELCLAILRFYIFTKDAKRISTTLITDVKEAMSVALELRASSCQVMLISRLIGINKNLADVVKKSCGDRFFGNISTRCQKLFPSMRDNKNHIFVSPRNSNKESLTFGDMIVYRDGDEDFPIFVNLKPVDIKPSVDSPTQLRIYQGCPKINFLIHGHAFIDNAKMTNRYYLCGDVREADEVIRMIGDSASGAINLKNHGFLIYANTIDSLEEQVKVLHKFTIPNATN